MEKEKSKEPKFYQIKQSFFTALRLLGLVWRVDHGLFIISATSNILIGVIPFVNAYIYKLVIDFVINSIQIKEINAMGFYSLIGLRIFTYFLQSISYSTQEYVDRILWTKVPIFLNQIFFKKITSLDMQHFENSEFRNLLEKARDGFNFRPQRVFGNVFYAMSDLITVLIALTAIAKLNGMLIIFILIIAIPEFLVQTHYSKLAWGIWGGNSALRKRFDYLIRVIQGHREIKETKLFRLATRFLTEIKMVQEKFYKENKVLLDKNFIFKIIFRAFSAFIFIGVEVFVILGTIAGRLTVGDIGFYTKIVSDFQNSLIGFFRGIAEIFESSLYVKSMFDVLDTVPIIKMVDHPVKLNLQKSPTLEFKNVTFVYPGTDIKILNNFSLVVKPGEKIAFVGENGAGKTTIIKLLARFYDVTDGEILINGVNVKNVDLDEWYDYLGILFQDFTKYEDTVNKNIGFGKVDFDSKIEDIIKASKLAGSHKMITGFEKGYDQMLGRMFDEGLELSGGQWQKVALARAFFRNAPVLVLDEPTAAIDAKAESEIFNRVEKLSKDKTVIIISHRFSTVRNADKIYVIDNGRIVENGSHEQLMKLSGQYASLFKLQAKGYQ